MDIISPKEAIRILKNSGAKMEKSKWSTSFLFSKGQALLRQFNRTNWIYRIDFFNDGARGVSIHSNAKVPTEFNFETTDIEWERAFKTLTFKDPGKYSVSVQLIN